MDSHIVTNKYGDITSIQTWLKWFSRIAPEKIETQRVKHGSFDGRFPFVSFVIETGLPVKNGRPLKTKTRSTPLAGARLR